MKKRLNITVEEKLLTKIKKYAEAQDTSISSLVEEHFEKLLMPENKLSKKIGLVDFVKSLPPSKKEYPEDWNWKTEYRKAKESKYGY
ncbi:MAG: hypothetical protein EA341_07490 [Mongoliibacter sp.]|uniref:DUF6364 family protein n=1 Tax=Mongoliibacter sp. TaxID=2022438 RepID=UPI0012F1676A|nr:DUF6364 family protein [Mongoliibacter sp.]TVP50404.1 MAG: hypothetical protein EA341_07490 [Mongoliibacter sp.]